MPVDVKQIGERVAKESALLAKIRDEIGRVIVGQEMLVDRLLLALLCNHHVLIEGVPGLVPRIGAAAMAMPGTILSQFATRTRASNAWPSAITSIESMMSSREGREYFMPE